jgi:uncharacterized protein (TIGR02996 family)
MRKFTYSDAKSHKFWNIELTGSSYTVTYGRQGTPGTTQTKKFATPAAAQKEHDKLIAEKLKKGYTEQGAAPVVSGSMRDALEAALVADPDDLASHMAYADWLNEQGDPLGEFIQTQLALEDEKKPAKERKALQKREEALLKAHRDTWLGDLAGPLLHPEVPEDVAEYYNPRAEITFARGWVQGLELNDYMVPQMRALARSPKLALLRTLCLGESALEDNWEPADDSEEEWDAESPHLYPLIRCPYLGNVRRFTLGGDDSPDYPTCHTAGQGVVGVIKQMPRLEELYLMAHRVDTQELFALKTLGNLRVLQVYHTWDYPLKRLGANASLTKLTTLRCHPHGLEPGDEPYIRLNGLRAITRSKHLTSLTHLELRLSDMGDEGAREIASSGILKRLNILDLMHGKISDAGARLLAACPDIKNLERLDLTNNSLTAEGIALLKRAVPGLVAQSQWTPTGNDLNDREYLWHGDAE